MEETIIIRTIEPTDNAILASIIRTSLEEFNANKPGTVYFDETTDNLYQLFSSTDKSIYFVAEENGKILGGGGIFPTENLPEGFCELVKMYLTKNARGKGLGRKMLEHCLQAAKDLGYTTVYLESMPELSTALKVYEKLGFEYINFSLGRSGHCGCDIWMQKKL